MGAGLDDAPGWRAYLDDNDQAVTFCQTTSAAQMGRRSDATGVFGAYDSERT